MTSGNEAVLGFTDRRTDGRYPVSGTDGRPVAWIKTKWTAAQFSVESAAGGVICTARTRRAGWSRHWELADGDGCLAADLKIGNGNRHGVTLPEETQPLTLQGSWRSRDWQLTDGGGSPVLAAVATSGAWSFRPDEWVIKSYGRLELGLVVGIVEAYRLIVKARRNAAVS